MMNHNKTLVFDLDDTISFTIDRDFANAKPNTPLIGKMRRMHEAGYYIIILTARGQNSCNGDSEKACQKYKPQIEQWLKDHDVPYDEISFDKPLAALYIDDKAITPDEFVSMRYSDFNAGMSGAKIELRGDFVFKQETSIESAIRTTKWYEVAQWIVPVPKIHSLVVDTIKMDFIRQDLSQFNYENPLGYLMTFKLTPPLNPGNSVRTYMQRIIDHMTYGKNAMNFTGDDVGFIRYLFEHNEEMFNSSESFCHGDFSLDNMLCGEDGVTYLIDPIYLPDVWQSFLIDVGKFMHSARRHKHYQLIDIIGGFCIEIMGIQPFTLTFMELCEWIRILKYVKNDSDYMQYMSATKILLNQLRNLHLQMFDDEHS